MARSVSMISNWALFFRRFWMMNRFVTSRGFFLVETRLDWLSLGFYSLNSTISVTQHLYHKLIFGLGSSNRSLWTRYQINVVCCFFYCRVLILCVLLLFAQNWKPPKPVAGCARPVSRSTPRCTKVSQSNRPRWSHPVRFVFDDVTGPVIAPIRSFVPPVSFILPWIESHNDSNEQVSKWPSLKGCPLNLFFNLFLNLPKFQTKTNQFKLLFITNLSIPYPIQR